MEENVIFCHFCRLKSKSDFRIRFNAKTVLFSSGYSVFEKIKISHHLALITVFRLTSGFSGTSGQPILSKPRRVTSPNLQLCPPKEFGSISLIPSEEFDSQGWLPIKKKLVNLFKFSDFPRGLGIFAGFPGFFWDGDFSKATSGNCTCAILQLCVQPDSGCKTFCDRSLKFALAIVTSKSLESASSI